MKYLLILLFSFNSYANYRVSFDLEGKSTRSVEFESVEKAQEFINENRFNKSWGKNELELPSDEVADKTKCKELKDVMQEDIDGNMKTVEYCVTQPTYKICGKYYYELDIAKDCEDISKEVAQEQKAIDDRKNEIKDIKDKLSCLDDSDESKYKSCVKKILKRLVKELRE